MVDSSVFSENSGGGSASDGTAAELRNEAVSSGDGGGGGEEGGRKTAKSRWPREEALALLKIRSDMDKAFRNSILKAHLWDEVSRKLGELGYNRNGKKCQKKFENMYKYHKRTKDGRSIRHNGKNYKFFEQLELLEPTMTKPVLPKSGNKDYTSASISSASSSGNDSIEEGSSNNKKRKIEDCIERLVKDVLEKHEFLQNKFLEALDKFEKDRIARRGAWKLEEMARIMREENLAQERSNRAAKDAAILAFLQKITHEHDLPSHNS